MAKGKKKPSKKGSAPRAKTRVPRQLLDRAGAEYARLLADPCNAALVHPTYSGSEGGYLIRTESFSTVGNATGHTAGYLQWCPGLVGSDVCVLSNGAVTAGTSVAANNSGSISPGYTFLRANASVARCVAACIRISYPGTESGRSGRVHYGQGSGGALISGTSYTADGVAQAMPHYSRTPAQEIELVWKPNDADQLFREPGALTTEEAKSRHAALTVAWAGLPADVGLTFRFTAVYEWQPEVAIGMSVPNLSKSSSSNTLDHVVNYLVSRGFSFVRHAGLAVGQGMVGAIANTFGIMPARGVSRGYQQLTM